VTELDPTVADECHRLDLTVTLAAELLRMIDAVARGPAGRHLRHCRGEDGRPLFTWAMNRSEEVIVAPVLLDLVDVLKRARPDAVCPECRGEQCPACRHAGYLPSDRALASADAVVFEPSTTDVSEFWSESPAV
jgi:hypothetical protein